LLPPARCPRLAARADSASVSPFGETPASLTTPAHVSAFAETCRFARWPQERHALAAAQSLRPSFLPSCLREVFPPARAKTMRIGRNASLRLSPPTPRRAQNARAFCLALRSQSPWSRPRSTKPFHCSVKTKTARAQRSSFVYHESQSLCFRRSGNQARFSAAAFAPRAPGRCGSGYAGPRFGRFAPWNSLTISKDIYQSSPLFPIARQQRPSEAERAFLSVPAQNTGRPLCYGSKRARLPSANARCLWPSTERALRLFRAPLASLVTDHPTTLPRGTPAPKSPARPDNGTHAVSVNGLAPRMNGVGSSTLPCGRSLYQSLCPPTRNQEPELVCCVYL